MAGKVFGRCQSTGLALGAGMLAMVLCGALCSCAPAGGSAAAGMEPAATESPVHQQQERASDLGEGRGLEPLSSEKSTMAAGTDGPACDQTPASIPGPQDQQSRQAAEFVRTSLSAVGQGDAKALQQTLGAVGFDPNDYGITWDCFARTCYQDFAFSVDEVLEGANAQGGVGVTFSLQVPVMGTVVPLMYQTSRDCVEAGANARKTGFANKAWKKAWRAADVGADRLSATLYVEQGKDGTWEFQDKAVFAALLLDGYDPRQA